MHTHIPYSDMFLRKFYHFYPHVYMCNQMYSPSISVLRRAGNDFVLFFQAMAFLQTA